MEQGRKPVAHGCCVPARGHCPGQQVAVGGSCCCTAGLWGWALLSGGGSINLWESSDQWKKVGICLPELKPGI